MFVFILVRSYPFNCRVLFIGFHATRFLGFSVYVSNTTNKEDGSNCFADNKHYNLSTIPAILSLSCEMHGRYVIYYNERKQGQPSYYSSEAFVELCEFEVNGKQFSILNAFCMI